MFALLIASQLSAPVPIRMQSWFNSSDYPPTLANGIRTAFQSVTQTLVDSTGKMIGCRIETPSSNPKVDALACGLILKRGRLEPARWSDGSPVPGVYRFAVSFALENDSDRIDPFSDIDISVQRLPNGQRSPAYIQVTFGSDEGGKIRVGGPPMRKKLPNPLLVSAACGAVEAQWKPFTVLGPDGKPSRSVQNMVVKFSTESSRQARIERSLSTHSRH